MTTASTASRVFVALLALWCVQKFVGARPDNQWDFRVYYYSTQAWLDGRDPYDTANLPDDLRADGFKFNYPPYALGIFAPLARLTFPRAVVVYLALKFIALVWLVRIWNRLLDTSVWDPLWALFVVFAYSSAIFVDFAAGSVNLFEQLLIWIGIAALLGGRRWPFVAAIIAASMFRLAPIVLLLAVLAVPGERGYRYLLGGAITFAGMLGLTWAVAPQLMAGFLRSIPQNFGERGWLNPALLPLAREATARVLDSTPAAPMVALALYGAVAILIIAVTIRFVARCRATVDGNAVAVYVVVLAYALVMPRFKNYHYVLLIVPTYFIIARSTRLRQAIPLAALACLPVFSWITNPANLALVANYSAYLIAFGAWCLFLYELGERAAAAPSTAVAEA